MTAKQTDWEAIERACREGSYQALQYFASGIRRNIFYRQRAASVKITTFFRVVNVY